MNGAKEIKNTTITQQPILNKLDKNNLKLLFLFLIQYRIKI